MGVKLSPIVPKRAITFEELAHKRIAIDCLQCLYQFLSSIRQPDGTPLMDSKGRITSHLMGIWSRFSNLMQKNLSLAVVFDGIPPKLKMREAESRIARKGEAKLRYDSAKDEEDIPAMLRYSKQFIHISQDMIDEAKQLLDAMGLPVIQAPAEADAQMAYMNRQNDVWACGTTDYDVLLHQAPRMITNLTLSQKRRYASGKIVAITPEIIELKEVLATLDIKQEQLVAIAIMTGTDYNPEGIIGIGPKKALKLVKQHPIITELKKALTIDFPWEEIEQLFLKMDITKKYQMEWSPMDVDAIKKILVDKHSFSEERIDNMLKKSEQARPKGQKSLGEFA
ncbi:MAG TPA: flap endonuclease-1 [Candidatus Nanoarchaeia archaeon]|nr:flap endonuclease-1 [Candidatus Nanoarchaeia archaeon]